MSVAITAVQNLRFGLDFAADRYRAYAERIDVPKAAGLVTELARERSRDANALASVVQKASFPNLRPTIDHEAAAEMLVLGPDEPADAVSAMFRVQRSENQLGLMTEQLASLIDMPRLHSALIEIWHHIERRKPDVSEMRRHVRRYLGLKLGDSKATAKPVDGQLVDVWFGTNRGTDRRGRFSGARSGALTFGSCRVFVPAKRSIGSLGSGWLGRFLRGDDRVQLRATAKFDESSFWSRLHQAAHSLSISERQGLIFLHGYCTKFENAALRAAQLKIDLSHAGPVAFFSWPSLGSTIGYAGDEAAIEGSEESIQKFITDFAVRSGVHEVHIIAHSMGNRGLLRAMSSIASSASAASNVRFGQIFLAAPDVDAQLFKNLASAYTKISNRTTLYVSDNDQAIGVSRLIHASPRAGLMPPVLVLPGVDTVDASAVNLGMWKHGYAAEMRPVLADMYDLMRSNNPPQQRFGLHRVGAAGAVHWKIVG